MDKPAVFIGGAGRSGTTLVVDMLGLHPDISPVYETSFVITLLGLLLGSKASEETLHKVVAEMDTWTKPLPVRPHFKREHERFFHGPHYILFERPFAMERTNQLIAALRAGALPATELRSFILDLFADHTRRDEGDKKSWVNKTPDYVLHLDKLRMVFPDLKFIHCVRDGRDVAASVMTRSWGPKTIERAAQWWMTSVSAGLRFGDAHPPQCLQVRYEDLLRSPDVELKRMLDWLGAADKVDEILARYQEGPITLRGETDDKPTGLSKKDAATFTQLAMEVLRRLQYI